MIPYCSTVMQVVFSSTSGGKKIIYIYIYSWIWKFHENISGYIPEHDACI